MRTKVLASLVVLVSGLPAHAASTDWPDTTTAGKTHFLRGSYQYGTVLQTNDFVKGQNNQGEPIDRFQSARLEFGWQTDGRNAWEHLYNFPAYGIGILGADYFEFEDEIGNPSAFYGFFNWPAKRWGGSQINLEFGLGLSEDWHAWDPVENPNNMAIGALRTIYIDLGGVWSVALGKRFDLDAGIKGTHFSNGGTRKPNHGINQVGGSLGLTYRLGKGRSKLPERRSLSPYERHWEFLLVGAGGINNINFDTQNPDVVERYKNVDYLVLNLGAGVNWRVGYMSKFGGGIDLTYDDSIGAQIDAADGEVDDVTTSTADKLALGPWVGYEQVIDRGSVIFQLGYQVFRKEFDGSLPPFYQRLGVKYHVFRNTFLGVNVRFTDFSLANYLEFNIGQRWER